MKNIALLGSTGSIGTQTLDVVRNHLDEYNIIALSCKGNIALLEKQIREFLPQAVAVHDEQQALVLKKKLTGLHVEVLWGLEGLTALTKLNKIDLVVNAVVGIAGLIPTMAAIEEKIDIALANKETLVTAGSLVMEQAKKNDIRIIPIDSEHNAIFQCLMGNNLKDVNKIILTASGGPFRGYDKNMLENISVAEALDHPKWRMGKKITIDSATLMNKGLEVIEAKWLFDLSLEQIEVIIHPQSIIHSMVEYKDGSVIAQMANTDMRIPIHHAIHHPHRVENNFKKLDLIEVAKLTFERPDYSTFPCLNLAYEALRIGGSMPTVLNAANEVLVEMFLNNKIGFYDIPQLIELALEQHQVKYDLSIQDIIDIDQWSRDFVYKTIALGGVLWKQ